jgi:Bacterial membrane protein YfhO
MNIEQAASRRFWRVSLVPRLPAVGQLATLVVVATALLLPAPFIQNQLPAAWPGSDLMISHWPTALLIQRTFTQEHRLPLWDPYFGGGQPLAADPLAALFYPPTHLVHFLSVQDYYLVLIMGHLIFAGLGMLLLARHAFGLPRFPALVAAVSYMATPSLISHLGAGHITILQTVAWFPWLALACWATVREPRRWGALLGICLALTLLAGHPQMAYYGLLMTAGLGVWLLVKRWRLEGRRALLVSVAGLAAAGVIGVLLAAVHLLPLLEFTARSTRQFPVISHDAYPLKYFLHALVDQRPLPGLPPLGLPPPGLPWEGMITPGLAVLALALFAVVTRWRKAWPLVLGILLVAGLAMGNASPFYLHIARILPGLDRFRDLARIWFVALVPIALLAGLGADSLLRYVRRVTIRGTVAAGFLTVLVVALSLIVTDMGYAHVGDVSVTTTPSQLARAAAQLAASGRIYSAQENIPQVSAVQMQVRLADGWNPLLIESYVSYMQRAGGYSSGGYQLHIPYDSPLAKPNAVLLGLMNVSVVVSRRPLTDPRLALVEEVDGTLIYKNTADAGPAYLVRSGPDGNPPSLTQIQRLDIGVRAVTQTPEQETFTFSTSTAAYFVIATPAFPGWTADLDGHPAPIQLIAGVLPAIKLGPGTHTLSYTYVPSSVRLGALLSVVGLLAVLAWLIAGRRFKPVKPHWSRFDEARELEADSPDVVDSPSAL